MKTFVATAAAAAALALAAAAPASASIVSVLGTTAPWNPFVAGNGYFGQGDMSGPSGATSPISYAVNAGDSIVIDYLDGLTGSFGVDLSPIADARGYIDGIFGSGDPDGDPGTDNSLTGQGSQSPLPSFYIDPTNTRAPIWLNALLGAFVDSSGKVIGTAFATGNDAYNVVAPTGAVALLLGLNDDIFADNNGALRVSVTGSSVTGGVPEPATWAMMIAGFGLAGSALRRRRTATATATV